MATTNRQSDARSGGETEDEPQIESRLARTARFPVVAFIERRSVRERRLALAFVLLAVGVRGVGVLADLVVDRWWYDEVTSAPVWSTMIWAKVQLAVGTAIVSIAVLMGTLLAAMRIGPLDPPPTRGMTARYRGRMGPAHLWLVFGLAVVTVLKMVTGAVGQWQAWLLFRHGTEVGMSDPEFGHDLAFYLFDLPFMDAVSSWLRTLVAAATACAVFVLFVSGALRVPGGDRRSAPAGLRLIGALVGAWLWLQACHEVVVQRPSLLLSRSGVFDGAGFTVRRVVAPGLIVLAVAGVFAAAGIAVSARRSRLRPALLMGAIWGLLHVAVLLVIPAVVQRVIVAPAEADRELTSISRNLDATSSAYSFDGITRRTDTLADGPSRAPDVSESSTLGRLPVFEEDDLAPALQVLQGVAATRITDVDLDRYELEGTVRPVMVAARSADRRDLPERGWVQEHLVYTHGEGVVAVPADAPDPGGRPDVDAAADIGGQRRPLYFGETLDDWYAIVGTERREARGQSFSGSTGIDIGSRWRRFVLAAAVGEIEPFVSSELGPDARLLFRRGLQERLHALAPFLKLDGDPYPVVVDEGIVWVVDAYTVSSTYPYSQYVAGGVVGGDLAGTDWNYVHGSVKATVDAADGSVHLYRTRAGEEDRILQAWERILPGLIEPLDDMPESLRAHLRYPEDLFTIQTQLLGRYHVRDAVTLFDGSDRWSIAAAAGDAVGENPSGPAPAVSLFLPVAGGDDGDWVAMRVYSPGTAPGATSARDELTAYVVGDHDDPGRLELVTLEPASDRLLSGPQVAQSAIDADPELARTFTLLDANGSQVGFGPLTLVPVGDGLVWVRPLIVSGTSATTAPRVYSIVAVANGIVGEGADASAAVAAALAG